MARAVLFDLGNTLAAYYHAADFAPLLAEAIRAVRDEITRRHPCDVTFEAALRAATDENREAHDYRFTPMIERLERIFRIPLATEPLSSALCERFLAPIFAVGRVYDDVLPALAELRNAGIRTAIVSNTPWGSPAQLWRSELERLHLADAVDAVVLCGDVGWRKPAPAIFRYAMNAMRCQPAECTFVGDDLNWDVGGSAAVGMRPILLDRDARHPQYSGERVRDLPSLIELLG